MIDLRSDTVTVPTEPMRDAMARARVGDDVYGEDPTVNELQEYAAELLGKEAALFVPSGTLGNQLAIKVHTSPGNEVLVDSESHIFHYETAAPSIISGVQLHCLESNVGVMPEATVRAALRPNTYYFPETTLLCLENTHNRYGGTILPLENIRQCERVAREHGLAFHCDGARLWNACAASGISPAAYSVPFDTLSVCLSKGLGAPVGSLLVGSRKHIEKALKWRKILGAGMRQVGILAAAGLYVLHHHQALLVQDHTNARRFAETVRDSGLASIDMERVQTNLVVFSCHESIDAAVSGNAVVERCKRDGVLLSSIKAGVVRVVFHHQVSAAQTDEAAQIVVNALRALTT